jgi:hypothetical protein
LCFKLWNDRNTISMTVNMLGKIAIWYISRFIGSYICMIFLDAYSVLALISRVVVSCGYNSLILRYLSVFLGVLCSMLRGKIH